MRKEEHGEDAGGQGGKAMHQRSSPEKVATLVSKITESSLIRFFNVSGTVLFHQGDQAKKWY